MNTKNVKSYYHVTFQSKTTLSVKYAHFDGKSYFVKQRESRSYVNMTVPNDGGVFNRTYLQRNQKLQGLATSGGTS